MTRPTLRTASRPRERTRRGSRRKAFVAGGAAAGAAIGLGASGRGTRRAKGAGDAQVGPGQARRGRRDPLHQGADPHDGRLEPDRARRPGSGTASSSTSATTIARRQGEGDQPRGRTVVPGIDRAARPHRQPRQPARLPHADRERDVDRRGAGAARRAAARTSRRASSSPRWAAGTPTSSPSAASRRSPSSTPRCPTGRCFIFQGFTGPAVTNSLGKAFFESVPSPLAGPVRSSPRRHDRRRPRSRPRARSTTCACGRRSRTSSAARSTRWRSRPSVGHDRACSTRCCSRRRGR